MRQGQNPAKMGLRAVQPKSLGICLLSYIPMVEGYYKESLDVLKVQISSLYASTTDFDLIIFDNGSCNEVTNELYELYRQGTTHCLILSRSNIGKTGALNWMLSSLPNEWICYADGDIYFRKGWFESSKEIFDSFPNVGLVNAHPIYFDVLNGLGKAVNKVPKGQHFLLEDKIVPAEVIWEYFTGLGVANEDERSEVSKRIPVIINQITSKTAIIGAAHDQFLTRKEIARQIVPISSQYALSRDEDKEFNQKVDNLGFLQLSLEQPLQFHIGNKLDEKVSLEIQAMNLDNAKVNKNKIQARINASDTNKGKMMGMGVLRSLSRSKFFNRLFRRLYNFLFEYYAQ